MDAMTVASSRPERAARALDRLRERRPRVHCLTNTVVQKFTADGLSALGAIPSMTSSPEEIADFAGRADGLLVNLGTLDAGRRAVIATAVAVANAAGRPWVLDPVLCDVSGGRLAFARAMLERRPAALRGNHAEIRAIGAVTSPVVIETGASDRITRGGAGVAIANGHPWMAQVTGTGCLSGALVAAFLAAEPEEPLEACAAAVLMLGVAAEMAAAQSRGPGSLAPALLDALAAIGERDLVERGRVVDAQG